MTTGFWEGQTKLAQLPSEHVFGKLGTERYRDGFCQVASNAYDQLSESRLKRIARQKFLLSPGREWDKATFVQAACELTVGAFYAGSATATTKSDAVVRDGAKDVDWQVCIDQYTFNIEVKCSVEDEPRAGPKEVNLKFLDRVPDPKESTKSIARTLSKVGYEACTQKRADHNMKDHLINAHDKFGCDRHLNELNVLIVCCGTPYNINDWRNYLQGRQGLFTAASFQDRQAYANVDVVVLSSVRHLHAVEDAMSAGSWRMENTFNLAIVNPTKGRPIDPDCYAAFLGSFPNYTREHNEYEPTLAKEPSVSKAVRTYHFVAERLDAETRKKLWPGCNFPGLGAVE